MRAPRRAGPVVVLEHEQERAFAHQEAAAIGVVGPARLVIRRHHLEPVVHAVEDQLEDVGAAGEDGRRAAAPDQPRRELDGREARRFLVRQRRVRAAQAELEARRPTPGRCPRCC